MFGRRIPQNIEQKPAPKNEDCKIKFKRDSNGRAKEVEFRGKCSKEEIAIARESFETESKSN